MAVQGANSALGETKLDNLQVLILGPDTTLDAFAAIDPSVDF